MSGSKKGPHLVAELVAGHPQDNEPPAAVTLVQLVHLGVIPGGRASERRDVLNEDHFSPQGGETERRPRQQLGRELVELRVHRGAPSLGPVLCLGFLLGSFGSLEC